MNKARLNKFLYLLLLDRLTFGDMETILAQVEVPDKPEVMPEIEVYIAGCVSRIISSGLKCAENMCNTEYDDVRMVKNLVYSGNGLTERADVVEVPMCADCRKRNPEAVLL